MAYDRLSRWLSEWPAIDRRALEYALDDITCDDDGSDHRGLAAHWAGDTRIKNIRFYTYWLRFLAARGELDPTAAPTARVTRAREWAYVRELRRVSPVARAMYVGGLRDTLLVIDRDGDHTAWAVLSAA